MIERRNQACTRVAVKTSAPRMRVCESNIQIVESRLSGKSANSGRLCPSAVDVNNRVLKEELFNQSDKILEKPAVDVEAGGSAVEEGTECCAVSRVCSFLSSEKHFSSARYWKSGGKSAMSIGERACTRPRESTISVGRKNGFRFNERSLIYALKRNEPAKSLLSCPVLPCPATFYHPAAPAVPFARRRSLIGVS